MIAFANPCGVKYDTSSSVFNLTHLHKCIDTLESFILIVDTIFSGPTRYFLQILCFFFYPSKFCKVKLFVSKLPFLTMIMNSLPQKPILTAQEPTITKFLIFGYGAKNSNNHFEQPLNTRFLNNQNLIQTSAIQILPFSLHLEPNTPKHQYDRILRNCFSFKLCVLSCRCGQATNSVIQNLKYCNLKMEWVVYLECMD